MSRIVPSHWHAASVSITALLVLAVLVAGETSQQMASPAATAIPGTQRRCNDGEHF